MNTKCTHCGSDEHNITTSPNWLPYDCGCGSLKPDVKLMHNKMKKSELIHEAYYKGECRNASVARWDANRNLFVYWRTKFGERFLETILHPDDDVFYDVFYAECVLETPEEVIPFDVQPITL